MPLQRRVIAGCQLRPVVSGHRRMYLGWRRPSDGVGQKHLETRYQVPVAVEASVVVLLGHQSRVRQPVGQQRERTRVHGLHYGEPEELLEGSGYHDVCVLQQVAIEVSSGA